MLASGAISASGLFHVEHRQAIVWLPTPSEIARSCAVGATVLARPADRNRPRIFLTSAAPCHSEIPESRFAGEVHCGTGSVNFIPGLPRLPVARLRRIGIVQRIVGQRRSSASAANSSSRCNGLTWTNRKGKTQLNIPREEYTAEFKDLAVKPARAGHDAAMNPVTNGAKDQLDRWTKSRQARTADAARRQ